MRIAACLLIAACTSAGPVAVDPDEVTDDRKSDTAKAALPDVQCAGTPDAGATRKLRHFSSRLIVALGGARHRGLDLVATADDAEQVIRGEISYTLADKALEDEDVDVFACRAGAWKKLGSARTDDEGAFALTLDGSDRLPIGMRDMFVSVAGDRTGARFLALVADADTELAVSDVDGTLTSSENAFVGGVVGLDVGIHDGAAVGWQHVVSTGRVPTYVTSRARVFTEDTRTWLAANGMPRGPLRLAPQLLLPGSSTADFKAQTLAALPLPLAAGVGNRATDIDAYTNAGIPADHIFIKLPEFTEEVAAKLSAGEAVGFDAYPGPLADML